MSEQRNINDLFDELLIKIFTYLTPSQRLVSQRVCLRWLNLLRTSPKFTYQLYFNHCILDDLKYPAKHFLESPVRFDSIKFGLNCTITENCQELWKQLQHVTSVDISDVEGYKISKSIALMLSHMKNLKVLKVENQNTCAKLEEDHWRVVDVPKMLSSIDELRLTAFNFNRYDALKGLLGKYRNIKRVYLGMVHGVTYSNISKLLNYATIIKGISLEWDTIPEMRMEFVNKLRFMQLEELSIKSRVEVHDFLCFLTDTNNTVETIMPKITELNVTFQCDIPCSFETFHGLSALRTLRVCLSNRPPTGCFFGHTIVRNDVVRSLTIDFSTKKSEYETKICMECVCKMIQSYPNLSELELTGISIDEKEFAEITKYLKQLKRLTIDGFKYCENFSGVLEIRLEPNSHIKTLALHNVNLKEEQDIQAIAILFPEVQNIYFEFHKSCRYTENIVSCILNHYPHLERLTLEEDDQVHTCFLDLSDGLVEEIIEKGKNLKTLSLNHFAFSEKTSLRLFDGLTLLVKLQCHGKSMNRKRKSTEDEAESQPGTSKKLCQ